ncbi:MAG TPA: hypothetical protein VJZ26_16930 [Blastocatellia bacterium]|nr:hypothetical protein [Blastocatellia bacterium]
MRPQEQMLDMDGLDELIDSHVRNLANKLSRSHTIEEIEGELTTLNDLIYSYKRKDELLEKLLDETTSGEKRKQILQSLKAQRMRVAEDKIGLEQLHAKSHQLLERSILLVAKAQQLIDREAHKHMGYVLQTCGLCKGSRSNAGKPCPACKGAGTTLVR